MRPLYFPVLRSRARNGRSIMGSVVGGSHVLPPSFERYTNRFLIDVSDSVLRDDSGELAETEKAKAAKYAVPSGPNSHVGSREIRSGPNSRVGLQLIPPSCEA